MKPSIQQFETKKRTMKKRIAFISEHASPVALLGGADSGGQNVYVAELAAQLAEKGYEIDIFTRWEDFKLPQMIQYKPGVRIIHVEAGPIERIPKEELLPYMDDFTADLLNFIAAERITYDLIHANFFMSGLVAMRLNEKLNIPFVITFHALGKVRKLHQKEQDKFPEERLLIEEELVKKADLIIAECPQDKEDLMNLYLADPHRICIVPCGFNPEEFFPMDKNLSRMALNLEEDDQIILQLGRMVPRKGVDNVIRALSLLDERYNRVKLLVVGGDTEVPDFSANAELNRLRMLAKELLVEDRVIFTGSREREQLKVYYDAADIFVTTPWYEPFGITPLEAMACGTPVIGSEVGGIKYTLIDGKTGFLVPPKSPKLLADRIMLLFSNENLLNNMGEMALKHVHSNFTWEMVADQITEQYENILNSEEQQHLQEVDLIAHAFEDAARTFRAAASALSDQIADAAGCMSTALKKGNKILVCGNGGSAAESQHFAAELIGRFELPYREGLPVISLTADTSVLTAWSNDFGFDEVFARQVQAYGQSGDILLCLSTSGVSPNIIKAMETAAEKEMLCINMLGKGGGKAADHGFINLIVPSESSQRIQEVHLHLIHLLCGLIEKRLFSRPVSSPVYRSATNVNSNGQLFNYGN
jgi:D-inositol-3-phosphate glycosyltransferase